MRVRWWLKTPTVKRVTQELGGKSPNIVLDDADLEAAVTRGVLHMYNNTGQSCNAPSRMLVPRGRLAEAEQIAAAVSQTVIVGDTANKDTTMGPVVSKVQWDKIQGLIQKGIDEVPSWFVVVQAFLMASRPATMCGQRYSLRLTTI